MPTTQPAEGVTVPADMQQHISQACENHRERGDAISVRSVIAEVKQLNPTGRAAKNQIIMAGIDAWEAEQRRFGEVDDRVIQIFREEGERMGRRVYAEVHEIAAGEWEIERRAHEEDRRRLVELKGLMREVEDKLEAAEKRVAELEPLTEQLKEAQQALRDAEAAAKLREAEHRAEVSDARSEALKEAMASLKQADAPKPARARKPKSMKPVEDDTPAEVPDGDAMQAILDGKGGKA